MNAHTSNSLNNSYNSDNDVICVEKINNTILFRLNTTLALTSPASWGHDYGKAESWESEQTSEYLEPTSRGWAYRGTPAWNEQQTQRKEAAKARGEEIDSKPAQTQQQRKNCRVKGIQNTTTTTQTNK